MKTNRIIYGIDLGTTNSAVSRLVNGKPVTLKSALMRPVIPSCVAVTRKGNIVVGDKARNLLQRDYANSFIAGDFSFNSFIEFKRQMGKDVQYFSSILNRGFTPEDLSAELLMELKRMVYDDDMHSAVITVPAMFDNNQKDATVRAARKAGLDYVELLQEPISASIAYGLTSDKDDKYWLVFDMGGGTFDVALMQMRDGIVIPVDTSGCNALGGKDIDEAIIDSLIIPHLKARYDIERTISDRSVQFKSLWKNKVEECKIALSTLEQYTIETDVDEDFGVDDNGVPIELELVVSRSVLNRIQQPIFEKCVAMTLNLLERAGVSPSRIRDIVLVGGPTMTPLLRQMLQQAIPAGIRNDIDPMTCVSQGAAIYASTITLPDSVLKSRRSRDKIQLEVIARGESAELVEYASVKILPVFSDLPPEPWVSVEFSRSDGLSTTPLTRIDQSGDVVELQLKENCVNIFNIRCFDWQGNRVECEPSEISIIQGIDGIGEAIMPMSIGIGVSNSDNDEVFKQIPGLQRGVRLPSDGVVFGLRTRRDILPADSSGEIRMSLYQKENFADMKTRTILCNHLYDVYINGDDIPAMLPAGSDVNLRMHADKSGRIDRFIVDIPVLDYEIDVTERVTSVTKKEISLNIVTHEVSSAIHKARILENEQYISRLSSLVTSFRNEESRDRKDTIFNEICELSERIDREFNDNKLERAVKRLKSIYLSYSNDIEKYGTDEDRHTLKRIREKMQHLIESSDYDAIAEYTDQLQLLDYRVAKIDYFIAWVSLWNSEFSNMGWRDAAQARSLIDNALLMIEREETAREMTPVIEQLKALLPDYQIPVNDILQG